MLKQLLLSSAFAAAALSSPAWAQDSETPTPLPTPEQVEPSDQLPLDQQPSGAIGEVAPTEPVMPPPAEAIIPAQAPDEVRANTLIGMTVYNTEGEMVGEVKDILLDGQGQVTGMVLSVGGVLGLGAKSVGLNWSELDVNPEADLVKIHYSKAQLEAAPSFLTQEAQQAEQEEMELRQGEPPATGTIPQQPAPDAAQ